MLRSRIYLLIIFLFVMSAAHAQPYWQQGTKTAYGSASTNLEGLASGLTNAGANICVGYGNLFTDKTAYGIEFCARWAPLTGGYVGRARLQKLAYGSSVTNSSVWLGAFVEYEQNLNMTITGDMFGSVNQGIGVGAQYTYWLTANAGIYFWPQISRTNGGPSGLWDFQLIAPVGVQVAW